MSAGAVASRLACVLLLHPCCPPAWIGKQFFGNAWGASDA
jgi:hypothetical protein